eukprot:Gb_05193 [translate_table: standard]
MERRTKKSDLEGSREVQHSPTHVARWEAYLMAREMTKSLEVDISNLDKSIKAVQRSFDKSKMSLRVFLQLQFISCKSCPISVASSRPALDVAHLRMKPAILNCPRKDSLEEVPCTARGTTRARTFKTILLPHFVLLCLHQVMINPNSLSVKISAIATR